MTHDTLTLSQLWHADMKLSSGSSVCICLACVVGWSGGLKIKGDELVCIDIMNLNLNPPVLYMAHPCFCKRSKLPLAVPEACHTRHLGKKSRNYDTS